MIRALLFLPATGELRAGDESLVQVWREHADALLWLDMVGNEKDGERRLLVDGLGLHPMAVQDAQSPRHPAKLETFDDHVFILLKGLGADRDAFEYATIQLALFVGERLLVTRRSDVSPSVESLWRAVLQSPELMLRGPAGLVLQLARMMGERYLGKLIALEPRLEELEQAMLEHPDDAMLSELTGYKTELRKFRRGLMYHVQVFTTLKNQQPSPFSELREHELNDVYEQQERASSLATLYYELAFDLIEGYISLASHRLNHIMKLLTIVTAIFVPLGFLAGIYGMNFENMPELHSSSGYFILLAIMSAIAVILLFLFRRMRWL